MWLAIQDYQEFRRYIGMESEQENEIPTRQITIDPEDNAKLLVACYRVHATEPVEPITPKDRRKPPKPEVRVGFWHDPQLPLLCGLGMPGKTERVLLLEPGEFIDERFKGFLVELFGVRGPVPDDVPLPSELEPSGKHWATKEPEREAKPDGLRPGGYTRCQRTDTKEIVEMHVWRHRVFLDNSPIYVESLWSALTGWVPMICGIQFADPARIASQLKRLADGIMLGFLTEEELNKEARGGAHNIRYPYTPQQKVALHLRYKELVEEYKNVCKSRKVLQRNHPVETVRTMIESAYPALNIPQHVVDRLLDLNCQPSEKSARPLALEHAAIETLRNYTPWLYGESDLLYLQREGEKLHRIGMQPPSKEE